MPVEVPPFDRLVLVERRYVLLHEDGSVDALGDVPDDVGQLVLLVRLMAASPSLLTNSIHLITIKFNTRHFCTK